MKHYENIRMKSKAYKKMTLAMHAFSFSSWAKPRMFMKPRNAPGLDTLKGVTSGDGERGIQER